MICKISLRPQFQKDKNFQRRLTSVNPQDVTLSVAVENFCFQMDHLSDLRKVQKAKRAKIIKEIFCSSSGSENLEISVALQQIVLAHNRDYCQVP